MRVNKVYNSNIENAKKIMSVRKRERLNLLEENGRTICSDVAAANCNISSNDNPTNSIFDSQGVPINPPTDSINSLINASSRAINELTIRYAEAKKAAKERNTILKKWILQNC